MYEFNVTLNQPFDQAVETVCEAMISEQFGIISDVDVQAILRNKMGKEISAYHIFGACNPKLAHRVIRAEPNAGTLLPCNFIMREEGGSTVVSFMDPITVLGLSSHDELHAVASEVRVMLQKVVEKLSA